MLGFSRMSEKRFSVLKQAADLDGTLLVRAESGARCVSNRARRAGST